MTLCRATLLVATILVAVASCNSSSKPRPGDATYRLQCDNNVPREIAERIDGKVLHEGRNELDVFPTGRVFAVVKGGQLDSLVLEVKGEQPTVAPIARMPDPRPTPPIETPMGCDQRFNVCIGRCSTAPDPQCCKYKCFFEWVMCSKGIGITIA